MAPIDRRAVAESVYNLAHSSNPIAPLVREALEVIDSALDSFKPEHLTISFNGGKDCTVLLHLYAGALSRRFPDNPTFSIRALYIPLPSPYQELEAFIQESVETYNLDLFHCLPGNHQLPVESAKSNGDAADQQKRYKGGEAMRKALEVYKEKFPGVEGILIGMRRSDPHGKNLSFCNPTDPGWPRFERINPIINWSYTDVWKFLRELNVPYCGLYDKGYTSIGSTYNTFRNPALEVHSSTEQLGCNPSFRPAYELLDGTLERAGRGVPPPKTD